MLVDNFRITPRDDLSCNLAWTSPWPDGASWVFINGKHAVGPLVTGTAERMVKISFALGNLSAVPGTAQAGVARIEIHDFPDDTVRPDPIQAEPNTRPLLSWNPVEEAARYRIYHRKRGDVAETVIYDKPALQGLERCEVTCPVLLDGRGGVWHFLRVEAVDEYGNESTRQSWTCFVMDLPPVPERVLVTEGVVPGTYDFHLED